MAIRRRLERGNRGFRLQSAHTVVRMPKEKTLLRFGWRHRPWLPVLSGSQDNSDSARCYCRIRRGQQCKVACGGVDRVLTIDRAHSIGDVGELAGLLNDNLPAGGVPDCAAIALKQT